MNSIVRLSLLSALLTTAACTVHETRVVHEPPPPPPAAAPVAPAAPPAPASPVAAQHPAYLHALSDLRNARANLERKGGDRAMRWDEGKGIQEIDAAIAEIKRAAIDDGKNLEDHPAVDAREPRDGRLHKALAALKQARADIEQAEENGSARGLRARANIHIDEAIKHTEEGIRAAAAAS